MSLPFSTTTISIRRGGAADGVTDGYDGYDVKPEPSTVATGVAAVFHSPAATSTRSGGNRQRNAWRFAADPCDLRKDDTIIDETDGTEYLVDTVVYRADPNDTGLEHVAGDALLVQGGGGV